MNIQYIGHSGFSIELEHSILLFDYFEGTIPKFPHGKSIYVFSSHFHHDHFNMEIFKLTEKYADITYILSADIGKKFKEKFFLRHGVSKEVYDRIVFLPERVTQTVGNLEIQTFHSTDEGIAFLITTEGKRIYHAGDLQWWTWPGETKEEYEAMTSAFQNEIASIPSHPIDVAFLVLDPRQEANYYMGFDYFMRHTYTKLAYPMHFWNEPKIIDQFLSSEITEDYRDRIVRSDFYK